MYLFRTSYSRISLNSRSRCEKKKSLCNKVNNIDFSLFDDNKSSYNIGDLLNMPYFFANWNNTPHDTDATYNNYERTALEYEDTILGIYNKSRSDPLEPIPNVSRIHSSVDTYIEKNIATNSNLQHILEKCNDDTVLFVHLRSGDYGLVEDGFINIIHKLSVNYKQIVILCGIHHNHGNGTIYPSVSECIENLKKSLCKIVTDKITIDTSIPDVHICAMRRAKNLLVHRGGFSVLGSLIFTGKNIFISKFFSPFASGNIGFMKHLTHGNVHMV